MSPKFTVANKPCRPIAVTCRAGTKWRTGHGAALTSLSMYQRPKRSDGLTAIGWRGASACGNLTHSLGTSCESAQKTEAPLPVGRVLSQATPLACFFLEPVDNYSFSNRERRTARDDLVCSHPPARSGGGPTDAFAGLTRGCFSNSFLVCLPAMQVEPLSARACSSRNSRAFMRASDGRPARMA